MTPELQQGACNSFRNQTPLSHAWIACTWSHRAHDQTLPLAPAADD